MKAYIKDYPRPQLVRNSWVNLNGEWDFLFDDRKVGEAEKWQKKFPEKPLKIQVPFTYETKMSGIEDTAAHEHVWYHKELEVTAEEMEKRRVLLHFEGCDFATKLWVNGEYVGSHKGGYARFSFDITGHLQAGKNQVTVYVEDTMSIEQPRGKQRWLKESFGCWYVQTTGIWKTVWMEFVPETYLVRMKMTPNMEEYSVYMEYEVNDHAADGTLEAVTEVWFEDTLINRSSKPVLRNKVFDVISLYRPDVTQWGVWKWTIINPFLYDVKVSLVKNGEVIDEIGSYFGLRDIQIEKGSILLNGNQLYQRLILDQGYWEDSHLTAPSEEALIEDIDKIVAMGYNGVRKHMKIEDERFLYWCDKKGVLVWSEMAAAFEFGDNTVEEFTKEWMEIVRQNYNHPSIVAWTPFNESWGVFDVKTNGMQQKFTEAIYNLTKSMDPMRPVVVNDGGDQTVSDIITMHDYEQDGDLFFERFNGNPDEMIDSKYNYSRLKSAMVEGYAYKGQPIMFTEFGGIAMADEEKDDKRYGYGEAAGDKAEFIKRFDKLTTAVKKLPYVVGYCYTQVSDVQQENNGLLNKKHEFKVAPEVVKEINCREVGKRRIGDC